MGTVDVQRVRHLIEFASTHVPIRGARLPAIRRHRRRRARSGVDGDRPGESGAGDAAQRDTHRGGAPAALRQQPGQAGDRAASTRRAEICVRTSSACSADRSDPFPSDYRTSLGALNRGEPLILQNRSSLAFSSKSSARDVAELPAPPPEAAPRPGLLGLAERTVDSKDG